MIRQKEPPLPLMDQDVGDKAGVARSPCVGADRSRAMGKVLARGGPWLKEIQVMLPALEIEEIRSSAAAGFKPPCLAEAAAAAAPPRRRQR